jgi:hypothetical protein
MKTVEDDIDGMFDRTRNTRLALTPRKPLPDVEAIPGDWPLFICLLALIISVGAGILAGYAIWGAR